MKVFSKIKRSVRNSILLSVVTVAAVGLGLSSHSNVDAVSNSECGNAVVCGGVGSASALKSKDTGSVKNIYESPYFGITTSDVNQAQTHSAVNGSVMGSVTRGGDVIVDGKVIATGAYTAGREYMSGSTKHTYNGTTFYTRPTSVSFLDSSLSAIVDMKDGVFQWAVLTSCGNPVHATPKKVPQPNYSVTKLVSEKGKGDFQNNITVDPGTHVEYKVTVASTGDTGSVVKNITVRDDLPKNVTYVNNSLTRDGNNVSGDSKFFDSGLTIDSLKKGDSTTYKFEAIIGKDDTVENCNNMTLDNEGIINAPSLPKKQNGATVNEKCLPKPTYACTDLNADKLSDDFSFKFTAKSKVDNGAKVKGYDFDFGDGSSKHVDSTDTSAATNHTYAKAGTYNAVVTAIFNAGGDTKKDTGSACKTSVTIKPPVTPVYACNGLTAVSATRTDYTFTATATATNGATVSGYTFDFGDGSSKSFTSTATTGTAQHSYAAPGTYNAVVAVWVKVNGKNIIAPGANCKTTVTVNEQPAAECTGLTITNGDDHNITANVTYNATNGAKLSNIAYDFGDNSAVVNSTSTTAGHTYAQDGNYVVKAVLTFTGVENDNTSTCQAPVSFTTQPVYTCDELDITQGDNRTVTVSKFTTSQTGATFTGADINWGDGKTDTNVNPVMGATHTYANDGTYAINAVAHFDVNGVDVTNSNHCQASVTFKTQTCTPPQTGTPPNCSTPCTTGQTGTPPNCTTPPSTLVNTGAGSVAGLFGAVAIVGAFAHRMFLSRRLGRELQ